MSPSLRTWLTAALIALALSLPATMILLRRLPPQVVKVLAWPAFVWMGLMFLTFVLVLVGDVLRGLILVGARVGSGEGLDAGRRLLLSRVLGGGAGAMAGLLGGYAVYRARVRLDVTNVEVPLARLAAAADGTTIVQLTDMHVGGTISRAFVEHVVDKTNALHPDVVAITGDLVDGSVARLRDAVAPLGQLKAKHGVYFVTGNHEYFSGADAWIEELERIGIKVLRNARVTIGSGEAAFDLAGVNDFSARRHGGEGPDLAKALAGRDSSRALVLMAHQPKAVTEAATMGVDLQLSGHTHGGQIWPFSYFVKMQQPFVAGLHKQGDTAIYVSCGTGYWGPPMRLGTRAEIAKIVLRRAA